jgi:hypothetical protein
MLVFLRKAVKDKGNNVEIAGGVGGYIDRAGEFDGIMTFIIVSHLRYGIVSQSSKS